MVRQRHHKHDAKRASDLWPARGLARPNRGLVQCPDLSLRLTPDTGSSMQYGQRRLQHSPLLARPEQLRQPGAWRQDRDRLPSRFLQTLDDGKSVFVWISEKMLDVANPTVIKETPFFAKFRISYAPRKRRQT